MVNLKVLRKIFFLLTKMLQSRPLLEGRGELRKTSFIADCESTKVQIGYLPITSLYVCLSRVHFSTLEYRMQYNSHMPPLSTKGAIEKNDIFWGELKLNF